MTNATEFSDQEVCAMLAERFRRIWSEMVDIDSTAKTHARNANEALRNLETRISSLEVSRMAVNAVVERVAKLEAATQQKPGAFVSGMTIEGARPEGNPAPAPSVEKWTTGVSTNLIPVDRAEFDELQNDKARLDFLDEGAAEPGGLRIGCLRGRLRAAIDHQAKLHPRAG